MSRGFWHAIFGGAEVAVGTVRVVDDRREVYRRSSGPGGGMCYYWDREPAVRPATTSCPKCACHDLQVKHDRVWDHLQRWCTACEFSWRERPLDTTNH